MKKSVHLVGYFHVYMYHDARFRKYKENLHILRSISLDTAYNKMSQSFNLKNSNNFCIFVFSFAGLGT